MRRHYFANFGRRISNRPICCRQERPRPACDPHDVPSLSLTSLVFRRDPRRRLPPVSVFAISALESTCHESFLEEIVSTLKHSWGVDESLHSGERNYVIRVSDTSVRTREKPGLGGCLLSRSVRGSDEWRAEPSFPARSAGGAAEHERSQSCPNLSCSARSNART